MYLFVSRVMERDMAMGRVMGNSQGSIIVVENVMVMVVFMGMG